MANIESLISDIPEYANDIKLTIIDLLKESDNKALNRKQIAGTALACAYATKEKRLIRTLISEAKLHLEEPEIRAIKIVTTAASTNNIYHRFSIATKDPAHKKLPDDLNCKNVKNCGIDQGNYEIFSLAVSIINNCSDCIKHHYESALKHKITKEQLEIVAKITATIGTAAQILRIEEIIDQH